MAIMRMSIGLAVWLAGGAALAADNAGLDGAWVGQGIVGGAPSTVVYQISANGSVVQKESFSALSGVSRASGLIKASGAPGRFEIQWATAAQQSPASTPRVLKEICAVDSSNSNLLVCGTLQLRRR
jgi:hypothetical protein